MSTMFKPGDRIRVVMSAGCRTIRDGDLYTVQAADMFTVNLREKGNINYKVDRFAIVDRTSGHVSEEDDDSDLHVVVKFPPTWCGGSSKHYTYSCSFPDVKVGDYVIVPDRINDGFAYAVVRVDDVVTKSVQSKTAVVDVVDDSAYRVEVERKREDRKRRERIATLRRQAEDRVKEIAMARSIEQTLVDDPVGSEIVAELKQLGGL